MAKKLLFVATRTFWPASSIYLMCFKDKNEGITEPPDFIHQIDYIQTPGIARAFPIIMWKSILTGNGPFKALCFINPQLQKK